MTLDGAPGYTMHGVMPPAFNFPSHSDLFRSAGIAPDPQSYRRRDVRERYVLARLAPGVGLARARDAIDELASRLEREFPATNAGLGFRVTPLREMYSGQVRPYVPLLFGAVALVLTVACANVANLLLSRAIVRWPCARRSERADACATRARGGTLDVRRAAAGSGWPTSSGGWHSIAATRRVYFGEFRFAGAMTSSCCPCARSPRWRPRPSCYTSPRCGESGTAYRLPLLEAARPGPVRSPGAGSAGRRRSDRPDGADAGWHVSGTA